MIVKMTNKDENFYKYMGKFFGSRIVQTETRDRIYDDNNKIWYIYLGANSKPSAFISVSDNTLKNVYSNNNENLKSLISTVMKDINIKDSVVTKIYEDTYIKCGLKTTQLNNYKHFIMIRGEKNA